MKAFFLVVYRLLTIKHQNKISGHQQESILKLTHDQIIISSINLECHNWNPGIKNYHYLCNKANLHLTDEMLIIIPYHKSIFGIEKWPPIIIESKNHPTAKTDNLNGTIIKQFEKIEIKNNEELKIFFREKRLINSTVELNMKNVHAEMLSKIELWKKRKAGNKEL